jgi:hypothetical protein
MRARVLTLAGAAALLAVLLMGPATAGDWGGIVPAETTMAAVRAKYGAPTRTRKEVVQGYDTAQWIYDGAQAPRGIRRMTVDFGLLGPDGYKADVVRSLRLEPTAGAFNKELVLAGWGIPTGISKDKGVESYYYREGLFVYFKPGGFEVDFMLFTPPQPPDAGEPRP